MRGLCSEVQQDDRKGVERVKGIICRSTGYLPENVPGVIYRTGGVCTSRVTDTSHLRVGLNLVTTPWSPLSGLYT